MAYRGRLQWRIRAGRSGVLGKAAVAYLGRPQRRIRAGSSGVFVEYLFCGAASPDSSPQLGDKRVIQDQSDTGSE